MKAFQVLVVLIMAGIMACSSSEKGKHEAEIIDTILVNRQYQWKLSSPQPKAECDLRLSFASDNKMIMRYRGTAYEGYYKIDSTLHHYITINIFNKLGWDEACDVNPEYLSLYDNDTQFSYWILDDELFFQKNEKVIAFQRVSAN